MSEPTDSASRRLVQFPVSSTPLRALLWGISLAASIAVTALQLFPALMGRVILLLISVGFVLFSIARASLRDERRKAGFVAADLARPMRWLYWAGYGLMISGVVLSSVALLSR